MTILLAAGAEFDSNKFFNYCRDNRAVDPGYCNDPGVLYRFVQSFRYDVDLPNTPDSFSNPPLITGKAIFVAPAFQGITLNSSLSAVEMIIVGIEGDTVTKPEFQAIPLYEAVSGLIPVSYREVPGHHYAFIAPFPERLVDEIPVAQDPEGFDRAGFLEIVNQIIFDELVEE